MLMSSVYIYALVDPRTNVIRYVGKTKTLSKRLAQHLSKTSLRKLTHKNNWIRSLLQHGLVPTLRVLEITDLTSANDREIHWIARLRQIGVRLVNGTDGGDGLLGYQHSIETRQKLSKSHIGQTPWIKGKSHTAESRQKISEAAIGNRKFLGKRHTALSRLKISTNHKNFSGINNPFYRKTHSEISKAKMKLAWKRRKESAESEYEKCS